MGERMSQPIEGTRLPMGVTFLSAAQVARRQKVTHARILQLIAAGRIPGAVKFGNIWMIPTPIKITPGRRGPAGIARG